MTVIFVTFFIGGGGGKGRKVQLMNEVGGVLWECTKCTMLETFFAYHKDFLKIFILLILILYWIETLL